MAKTEVTTSYLKDIEWIEALEDKKAIDLEKACIDAKLSGAVKPFRFVPEVCVCVCVEIAIWKGYNI